jgi:hypothetical protein
LHPEQKAPDDGRIVMPISALRNIVDSEKDVVACACTNLRNRLA